MAEKAGKVWIVGAGPGDAGLITVKGLSVLLDAQVVVYDRLVGDGLLSLLPAGAECIDVGKSGGTHPVPQDKINEILCAKARSGKRVVRLKGGDPFIFGRGGEEAMALARAGIPCEVIPGVTAASAVPAYAGIPVTHRDLASSVQIVTGHRRADVSKKPDYEALARGGGTIVFYMGLAALEEICDGLIGAGMSADMPAAVISNGTTAEQKSVFAPLGLLAHEVRKRGLKPPALIVVGQVCSLSKETGSLAGGPLSGRRVIVTRPAKRSRQFIETLAGLGAEVVALPAIETVPRELSQAELDIIRDAPGYHIIAFTSAEGAQIFFDCLYETGVDIRALAGVRLAAIGPSTAEVLKKRGLIADIMPKQYNGSALGELLAVQAAAGERVLLPRSDIGSDSVTRPLLKAGIEFDELALYSIKEPAHPVLPALSDGDIVTFTSASTVRNMVHMYGGRLPDGVLGLCIGGPTAAQAAQYGIKTVTADRETEESMVEKLLRTV